MPTLRRLLSSRQWVAVLGFALFAYLLHATGNSQGWYGRYWWFQIAAHYVSATGLALLLARTGLDIGLTGWWLRAFVIGLAALGAVGWEAVEYLAIFPNLHFWGIEDMLLDLAADALGVLTVLVLLRTRLRPVVDPTVETPPLSALAGARTVEGEP